MQIHRSGHDPEAIAGALKASDDRKANPEVGRHAIHLTTVSTRALDHPDAIDHAEPGQRSQVVGHRFGDARREPIDCGSRVTLAKSRTAIARVAGSRESDVGCGEVGGDVVSTGATKRYPRRETV